MIKIHEGSSLYYSLLWTKPDARERFVNRLNLVHALNSTLEDVQEPQVAERKIHWWHEEIQRMLEGLARHPATQACQSDQSVALLGTQTPSGKPSEGLHRQLLAHLLSILSSVSSARFTPAADEQETDNRLTQNYVAQLALLSHALSNDVDDLVAESHSSIAALALAKHEQLTRLAYLLHRGHPVFSDETYQRYGIRPADLAKHILVEKNPDAAEQFSTSSLSGIPITIEVQGRKELLEAMIADTQANLNNAITDTQTIQRYRHGACLPIWRLLVLREKQAALWMKQQPDLLRERTTLTPLRKFFTAWRHRR